MISRLQDKEWLSQEYIENRRTLESIAEELGCNKATVGRSMRELGVQARKRTSKHALLADYDWLYKAYITDRKSMEDIAKEVNASRGVVREHLKQKGIPIRTVREGMVVAGLITEKKRLGDKGKNWRGGRQKTGKGYVYIYAPEHPHAGTKGCVMEHRLVMEEKLGRYLEPHEIVHHKDGNKSNNHIDNLEVTTRGVHTQEHFKASHEVSALRQTVAYLVAAVAELQKEVALLKSRS